MPTTNPISPETRAIIRAQMSRRGFIAGAGGLGAAGLLAACGTKSSSTGTAAAVKDLSDTEKVARWANWTLYLDYDSKTKNYPTLEAFKKSSGIDVTYSEDVDDNNTFYGKVAGQLKLGKDIGYDIVTLTDWMAGRWIRLGYTQAFDAANIPNKTNILPVLQDVAFDPGRNNSLTWQTGFAGFGWNKELLPKGVRSVDELFAPANKGRIEVLSEMRDTMGIIMQYQGVDISQEFTEDQFMNAVDFLEAKISDGFIRQVKGNSYKEDLISGDAIAVIGWSGDLFQLATENKGKFDFAVPDSGGTLWSDNMMIPSTSPHKKNAEAVINNYYDPAVAAQVAAYVNYICPVEGAQAEMEKIDPTLAASPYIFPDAAALSKVKVFAALSPADETKYQTAFQKATGN
ncbi:MAG: spermidine/putrescine ABC transporter substrate-binding protein [Streptomycetaceae bacterium]|nr:MAG: spermidine/putrescine ABC transporter substrate-binding protein [Streptomycetaceae bacterium]